MSSSDFDEYMGFDNKILHYRAEDRTAKNLINVIIR